MFTRNIRSWIDMLKEGELFFAKQTYVEYFEDMQENTFYQLLARLCKEDIIKNLSKGLYYKPYSLDFEREPSKAEIISFLTNRGRNGAYCGGDMYKKYGITSSIADFEYVFTNVFTIKSVRKINDLEILYLDLDYRNENYINIISCLELIEHIDSLEDINYDRLLDYFNEFTRNYNQSNLMKVLSLRKYKKRVLATVHLILNRFSVQNSLQRLLNKASKYEIPTHIIRCLGLEDIKND